MLTKSDVFEQISMFSEDYFMYSEDLDLCYKADRAGLKNYYIGQASMIHYGGTSSDSERQTSMKTRAELLFCEKSYGRSYTKAFRAASRSHCGGTVNDDRGHGLLRGQIVGQVQTRVCESKVDVHP